MAEKMLFMVAAMAAEMERELIRERTLDGLAAAAAQGRKGGRPPAVDPDTLAVAIARRKRSESVTAIAKHLEIGRSTLYRALEPHLAQAPTPVESHELSEFGVDVDLDGAEEVDVLAVRRAYVCQYLVIDPAPGSAHLVDGESVIFCGPGDYRVRGQASAIRGSPRFVEWASSTAMRLRSSSGVRDCFPVAWVKQSR